MLNAQYHFVTRWRVVGTLEEVFEVLGKPEDLARWWSSVYLAAQELTPGDEQGVGRIVRVLTKGFLPYTLSWQFQVVESRRPHGFTIEATGDFIGRGVWTFEQEGTWVDVTFDWRISVEKPGVRQLSPVLRPFFAANHRWAMRRGEESLKVELARRRAAVGAVPEAVPLPARTLTWPLLVAVSAVALGALAAAGLVIRSIRSRHRRTTRSGLRKPRR